VRKPPQSPVRPVPDRGSDQQEERGRRLGTLKALDAGLCDRGITSESARLRLLGPLSAKALDRGSGALWPTVQAAAERAIAEARANPWLLEDTHNDGMP
jgi:hypothetical protein